MSERTDKARAFAAKAHEGQVRKYTNEPYVVHPSTVADLVAVVKHNGHPRTRVGADLSATMMAMRASEYHQRWISALPENVSAPVGADNMVTAAYLHDTVEDTDVTLADIRREFGVDVADLVQEVTDVSRPEDGNRAVRKTIDREHLAKSSPRGATIKLADMIDNADSILRFDPAFAKIYMEEKRELLKVLGHGDPTLLLHATTIVNKYFDD